MKYELGHLGIEVTLAIIHPTYQQMLLTHFLICLNSFYKTTISVLIHPFCLALSFHSPILVHKFQVFFHFSVCSNGLFWVFVFYFLFFKIIYLFPTNIFKSSYFVVHFYSYKVFIKTLFLSIRLKFLLFSLYCFTLLLFDIFFIFPLPSFLLFRPILYHSDSPTHSLFPPFFPICCLSFLFST